MSVVPFLYRDTGPRPRLFSSESPLACTPLAVWHPPKRAAAAISVVRSGRAGAPEVHRHSLPRSCRRSLLETCRLLLLQRLLMLPAEEVLHSTSTIQWYHHDAQLPSRGHCSSDLGRGHRHSYPPSWRHRPRTQSRSQRPSPGSPSHRLTPGGPGSFKVEPGSQETVTRTDGWLAEAPASSVVRCH